MTRLPYTRLGKIAAAVAVAIGAPVLAQAADELQEVTVTGSRIILSPGMYTPTPVTSVTQEDLVKMAPTNVIDSLTALPQFFGNATPRQALGGQSPSGSQVNLRGANTSLGISRTLVLLDGRRSVPNSRFGSVDIASFPDELLRGVDVVTGGASATYGTDAVAGVVNFLLDTTFEGVKLTAQGGQTSRHDGSSSKFSLSVGHQFGEKFHAIGSLSYFDQDAIDDFSSVTSRPWFNQASRVPGGAGGPTWVVAPYVIPTNFSYNGTVTGISGVEGMQFSPDGKTLLPAPTGVLGSVGDACNCLSTAKETYGVNSMEEVLPGYIRKNAFVHLTYDLNDKVQLFAQGMYSDNSSNVRWQSAALLASWAAPVGLDNPYLTPGVRTTIQNALEAQFPNATGPLSAANGYGPGYRYVYPAAANSLATQYFKYGVFLNNVPGNPLGETRQITQNITDQGTFGFKANVGDWRIDGYVQKGDTLQKYIDKNGTRVDRLFFAMDAVDDGNGNPICRVASPTYNPTYYQSFAECVPINLFGGWTNISPQAAAYVSGPTKLATQHYDLTNGELTASGDLFEGFGAGPISAAFGGAWRKEEILQRTPNPADEYPAFLNGELIGNTIPTQPLQFRGVIPEGYVINQIPTQPWPTDAPVVMVNGKPTGGIPGLYYVPTGFLGDSNSSTIMFSSERTFSGNTTVKELFSEFSIPLLRDKPAFKSLSTSLAARWADYSGSGTVWAWKAGIDWALVDSLRLRVTRSRDVRAASLEERFDTTRGGVTANNPWVLTNGRPTTQSGASFSGGNPALKPEKADTWTAGFVFTPTFLEGFSTSIDWYKIKINDAIDQPTSQQVVDAAFRGDPQYTPLVKLDAGMNIVEVDRFFINFSKQFIEGVDLEASYRKRMKIFGGGPEDIVLRLYATDLMKNATLTAFGSYDEWAGQLGSARSLPKHKYTANINYNNGPLSVFMQGRYISDGILDHTLTESDVAIPGVQTINDNTIGSIFYMDMNVGYTLPVQGDLRIYGQVSNLLDREPPTVAAAFGRAGANAQNASVYDVIGRRYFVGVNYRF